MEQLVKYLKQHMWIMYATVTIAFCIIKNLIIPANVNTEFVITLVLFSIIVANIFIRKRSKTHNIIPYALVSIVLTNRLYSFERLKLLIPGIKSADPLWVAISIFLLVLLLIFVAKLISFIIRNAQETNTTRNSNDRTGQPLSHNLGQVSAQQQRPKTDLRKSHLQPLWIILILICILVFTFLTLYFLFTKSHIEAFDFFSLITYLVTYSTAIMSVLLAVGLTISVIIELIRFIYSRIKLMRTSSSFAPPIYVFSFVIVAALFYLSIRISKFTFDDFTEVISGGEYLALPLTLLIIITAFCILVRITHGLILLVMDMKTTEIKDFISKTARSLKLTETVGYIGKTVIGIVLTTITMALEFVKFIPDFFHDIYHFVFLDEDIDTNSEDIP